MSHLLLQIKEYLILCAIHVVELRSAMPSNPYSSKHNFERSQYWNLQLTKTANMHLSRCWHIWLPNKVSNSSLPSASAGCIKRRLG